MKSSLNNLDRKENYIILAENSYLEGNLERSLKFYSRALQFTKSKTENIAILYNIAIIYDEMDIPEKSLRIYKKILQLDNREAGAFYGMGGTMYERLGGEKEIALKAYFKATEIDPPYYDRAFST